LVPSFQMLRNRAQELVGHSTIDDTVIVAERDVADGSNRNGIAAAGIGHDNWHLLDRANAHDRYLRLEDDRQAEHLTELAGVGDGEGSTLYVVGQELLRAGSIAEIADGSLQSEEALFFRVLDDRHDQSPVESYGDADIDLAMVVDIVAFDRGIDDRELT